MKRPMETAIGCPLNRSGRSHAAPERHQVDLSPAVDLDEGGGDLVGLGIDLDEAAEDHDHLITPEERLRIAMARQ